MGLKRVRPNLCARAVAFIRGRGKLLPDTFVDEIGNERSFTARLCSSHCLHEACDLTQDSYGDAYVPCDIAEQWRLKNPFGFVQIMNPENRLCACFGVLALHQSFMDQLIAGLVCDQDLRGENVCSWGDSLKSSRLYISGVVVSEPRSHKGRKRAAVMFWVMLEYLHRLYGLKTPRKIYAVGVTRESRQAMENLGFVLEMPAAYRKDKRDLYRYDLTETTWNRLLCELNDWSRICKIDLTPPKATILFVAGDRGGYQRTQAQIPREYNAIRDALRASKSEDAFEFAPPILGADRQTLVDAHRQNATIFHFAGHGDHRSLFLVLDQGAVVSDAQLLAEELEAILKDFPVRVRLCVLNTCQSSSIAKRLVESNVVDASVGWPSTLSDEAAIAFSKALYRGLCDGLGQTQAVTLASDASGGTDKAILYTADGVDPHLIFV